MTESVTLTLRSDTEGVTICYTYGIATRGKGDFLHAVIEEGDPCFERRHAHILHRHGQADVLTGEFEVGGAAEEFLYFLILMT